MLELGKLWASHVLGGLCLRVAFWLVIVVFIVRRTVVVGL